MPSVRLLTAAQKAAIIAKLPESAVISVQYAGTDGSGNALLNIAYATGVVAAYSIDVTGVVTLVDLLG